MENSVMEIIKWFVFFVMFMILFSLGLFFIQMQDINPYKQTVNYTIERSGGLTKDAIAILDNESKAKYDNKYTVVYLQPIADKASAPDGSKVDKIKDSYYIETSNSDQLKYGSEVNYLIKSKFVIPIFGVGVIDNQFYGTSISQIRGT